MAFSSALVLTDLNDYISPSQACIKPVEVQKKETSQETSIKVNEAGAYYEVSMDGTEEKLESASISLNDCLACSGCITSAESVLITMQSQEELYKVLKSNSEAQASGRLDDIITIVISMSPQSRASIAAKYGMSPMQAQRKLTQFFKTNLGTHYFFDTSFSRDFSLVESAREFVERYRNYMANGGQQIEAARQEQEEKEQAEEAGSGKVKQRRRRGRGADGDATSMPTSQDMPMLASACPGWICYAEKTHGFILPHISAAKSPQQVMGSVVKDYFAKQLGLRPNQIYHISVMPCYDKKLEASRPDFFDEQYQTRDVDCVLTTIEVDKMFSEQNVDFFTLPEAPLDELFNKVGQSPTTQQPTLYGSSGSSSGGYLEYILAYAARELFGANDISSNVQVQTAKNVDFTEYTLKTDNGKTVLRFASAYGFRNIQNVVRKIKNNKCTYHFVEVMACPGGCINGGGQLPLTASGEINVSAKDWISHVENIYRSVEGIRPEDNEAVRALYREWIGDVTSERAKKLLRTQYHAVTQNLANPLATVW
ncbi:nuclear prelamin A recognition factor-like protein [Umbelopsis sp. PMI_123]|nr:nuclear prelamin A recognition factor-like protein [Umbelopsis sp. PMI_123]